MKYHKQTGNACVAYSLFQLGRVKKAAVTEYETITSWRLPSFDNVREWLHKYAPEVEQGWEMNYPYLPMVPLPAIPDGAGVAVIHNGFTGHAVSYENGKVLDPGEDAPGTPETLDTLISRYKDRDVDVFLSTCWPIKRKRRRASIH